MNIRYIEKNSIEENFLFCREIPAHRTGEEIYDVTVIFFDEKELEWSNYISVCTDGAPQIESFLAKVREKNPDMIANHCFLDREVLVAKTVPDNLKKVLNTSVKMVNFIKSRPLHLRLFQIAKKWMLNIKAYFCTQKFVG